MIMMLQRALSRKPQIQADIKNIERILEEVDRENFISLKKTKDLIKNVE